MMKKLNRSLANRAVLATVQVCLLLILAACAAAVQVSAPANDQTGPLTPQATAPAPTIPPGLRLEKFKLCYELRRPRASPLEAPTKHFSIDVSILVPQDDCLALDANGWLRVVPGQCSRTPAQSSCEDSP